MATDLTVGLVSQPGTLLRASDALGRAGINMEGACAFVCDGQGVYHVLVEDRERARRALIDTLRRWTGTLGIRGLGTWGVGRPDIDRLVRDSRGSSMRTNPIELADAEVAAVIAASL